MSDTKIKTSNIGNLAVTHALLHTDMDLTSKTVQVATPTSNTHPATKAYVDTEVANLIDSAPGTLDTLNELAAAINDDANFNATIASSIATKLPLAGGTLTGNLTLASTASGSSASPELELRRDITGVDANYLGQIKFTADNDADQNIVFAKITGKILDASDGTEDGIIEFAHKKAGSNNISARFRSDSLQLINGTNLTVAGTTDLTGNLTVDTNTFHVDTSNNRVGIGTSSPTHTLHTNAAASGVFIQREIASNAATLSEFNSNRSLIIKNRDSGSFLMFGGNGSRTDIQASDGAGSPTAKTIALNPFGGRVGIGIVAPDAPLHIEDSTSSAYGGIRVVGAGTGSGSTNVRQIADFGRTSSGSDSGVWLGGRTDETTAVIGAKTASGNIAFEVYQSGWQERMRIKNNGNVGIGDTNPAEKFTIKGDGARMTISSNDYEVAMLGRRGSTAPNWDRGYLRMKYDGANTVVLDTGGVSYLNGGNVGIGTSDPSTILHLAGDASPTITLTSSSGPRSYIESNTVGSVGIAADESNTGTSSNINFRVDGAERMRIYDSGDISIKSANGNNNFYWDASDSYSNGQLKLGTGTGVGSEAMLAVSRNYGDINNPLVHFDITGNDGRVLRVSSDTSRTDMQIFDVINNNGTAFAVRGDGNVGIGTNNPAEKLEIKDYKDGTGNNANGIGLRLSSTSSNTGSNSANGGTGIEFTGYGHNYNGAGTSVAGSNPIAIRINPVYEYWGQNNDMSNFGQTYPYLKFDFKKSDNVNYITPLLVSGLGNGRVAIGNDTASVSHRLSLGSDAKSFNYRVSGSGGHAIADGTYEENARSFSLGGSDTAFITEGTVSNSNKWRVRFEGDFGNNYQGGGLNLPAAVIYVTNTQPTVYIGSTNITVSRDSGTGKLKVTNQSGSYAVHFTGKITVWDHPQSNRPTFDSEMQAISLQGTDDYGTNLYGGLIMKTPAYSEYHFQWSGTQNHSLTFTCASYQMSTMEYTSHQTNGGADIHKYVFGKWGNNHTSHNWNQMESNGSTWGLTTTFTATDQSGGSSQANGKLVINETYSGGSVSTRTLVVKTYYGGWGLTFA